MKVVGHRQFDNDRAFFRVLGAYIGKKSRDLFRICSLSWFNIVKWVYVHK